jgi:UDP-2,3-diacylglucosamine hydrolase
MTTLFISDLHLDASRPEITTLFLEFLEREAPTADALYILGDLFEAWVGDDDPSEVGATVAKGLRQLSDAGVPLSFMRGNRDFLLGSAFAERAGMRILPDPAVVMLYDKPVLLMHGDLLCTADTAYQAFRAQTRNPAWQKEFLSQPVQARLAFATQARAASKSHQDSLRGDGGNTRFESITDVSPATVAETFTRFGIGTMIHGHTHRPNVHREGDTTRIVLGDWYEQGSVLRVDAGGYALDTL